MSRRRKRKWRPWLDFPAWMRRKMPYKHNVALREHEERVLLELIEERGCALLVRRGWWGVANDWWTTEPDRWDLDYLTKALKRLSMDKRLRDMIVVEGEGKQAA